MTKTRWVVPVVALFTLLFMLEGITTPLAGQEATQTVKSVSKKKPTASRHLSKEVEARRRLMRELYLIAVEPMPLRAGRAGLLFDRLLADDQERRIAEMERLRPRRRVPPVPVLIARHADPFAWRPGS